MTIRCCSVGSSLDRTEYRCSKGYTPGDFIANSDVSNIVQPEMAKR